LEGTVAGVLASPILVRQPPLEHRLQFSLARSEGEIYLTVGDATLQTVLARVVTAG
jgi:hypothetical protein